MIPERSRYRMQFPCDAAQARQVEVLLVGVIDQAEDRESSGGILGIVKESCLRLEDRRDRSTSNQG